MPRNQIAPAARESVVPRNPRHFGGFEGVDVSLVEGDPELHDMFSRCVVHVLIVVLDGQMSTR